MAKKRFLVVKQVRNNSEEELRSVPNMYFTFGVEIECFNVEKRRLQASLKDNANIESLIMGYNHQDQATAYKLGDDGSISGFGACELVSPILTNFESLKKVCTLLNEHGAQVNASCGLHVHFGVKNFSCKQIIKLLLDYNHIQNIIDGFFPQSRRDNRYCMHLRPQEIENLKRLFAKDENVLTMDAVMSAIDERYRTINVHAYRNHKTIEFRQHNGTTNYLKIRAWILFLLSFINLSLKGFDFSQVRTFEDLPINKTIIPHFKKRIEKFRTATND